MLGAIKKKRIIIRNKKGNFICIIISIYIIFILIDLSNESGSYSITIRYNRYNGLILNCGNGFMSEDIGTFTSPSQIRINNGSKEIFNSNKEYDLNEEVNTVGLFWENTIITNCAYMFYGCVNIIEIDFSNFNTAEVTTTVAMFGDCSSLISLNLENFDTSKVTDMWLMFSGCSSLISLNLFKFYIKEETYIEEIFLNCNDLSYINLGNATIKNNDIISELDNLSPNLDIIINNELFTFFKTLSDNFIFSYSIFQENKQSEEIEKNDATFTILTSINDPIIISNDISVQNQKSEEVKIHDSTLTFLTSINDPIIISNGISEQNQKSEEVKIKESTLAFTTPMNDSIIVSNGISEQNQHSEEVKIKDESLAYTTPINDSIIISNSISEQTQHSEEVKIKDSTLAYTTPINDSIISTNVISEQNQQSEKIDINIKTLSFSASLKNSLFFPFSQHQQNELSEEFAKDYKTLTFSEFINKEFIASYNISKQNQQSDISMNLTSIIEYSNNNKNNNNNSEVINKNNSFSYNLNYASNEEFIFTTNSESHLIKSNLKELNISHIKDKNELIKIIREYIINGKYNLNIDTKYYYDLLEDNIVIEITNTEKEKIKEKNENNKTSINFGICEYILKKEYNIPNSSYLNIFKVDIKAEGFKIPIIEYEVYYPFNGINLTQLNLTICKNKKVEISIPVFINDNIKKYNSSSDFYNDICSTTTSEFGTDISIKDRRDEFINNNMTLCEENCKLISFNNKTQKAKCSCDIKIRFPFLYEDITINKDDLYKSFIDFKNIANIHLMKYHKTVLTAKNLKNNYGSYIIFFILIIYFACLILFYIKYYYLLKTQINKFIKNISNSAMEINENFNNNNIDNNVENDIINDKKINPINKRKNEKNKKVNSKKKKQKKGKKFKTGTIKSELKLNENKVKHDNTNEKVFFEKKDVNNNIDYTDLELNTLSYLEALKIDKRTYIQYYISLLR